MTKDERIAQVLALYRTEPAATQTGETAGGRSADGVRFRDGMADLLRRDGVEVAASLAKSSDGRKLDGNASERTSYKVVKFKRNPLNANRMLVVALSVAFEQYDNAQATELREQVAYLNGIDRRAQVLVLSRPEHYKEYIERMF